MSQIVLLSFLGIGNYKESKYLITEQPGAEVKYFATAFAKQLEPDLFFSIQTEGAKNIHGEELLEESKRLGLTTLPQVISIPDGSSEEELWKIFEQLTSHIPKKCELHLDITHGFRSLPLLGFLSLAYLRTTREVTIGSIRYGAWEARNQETNIAPVFDLTPFLALLDWTTAADQFLNTGDAYQLQVLLEQQHQHIWENSHSYSKSDLPRKLKNLASALQTSTSNLLLLRTGKFQESAHNLNVKLKEAAQETEVFAKPFLELIEPVQNQLTHFADTDLATLRDLIKWLADRRQTAPALTLASEWITSYVMILYGKEEHHSSYKRRKPYNLAIHKLEQSTFEIVPDEVGSQAIEISEYLENSLTAEQLKILTKLASKTGSTRNDLNHAGFNDDPSSASNLQKYAQEIAEELYQLPLP